MHVLALVEAEYQAGHQGGVSYVNTIYETPRILLALKMLLDQLGLPFAHIQHYA